MVTDFWGSMVSRAPSRATLRVPPDFGAAAVDVGAEPEPVPVAAVPADPPVEPAEPLVAAPPPQAVASRPTAVTRPIRDVASRRCFIGTSSCPRRQPPAGRICGNLRLEAGNPSGGKDLADPGSDRL